MALRPLDAKRAAHDLRLAAEALPHLRAQPFGIARVDSHHVPADAGLELLGRAQGDDLPPMKEGDAVAPLGLFQKMRRQQNGRPIRLPKLGQIIVEITTGTGVETGSRLIHDEDFRPVQEGLGQLRPAFQAAGKGFRPVPAPAGQAQAIQVCPGPLFEGPSPHAVEPALVQEVLDDRELGVEARVLENHPDALSDGVRIPQGVPAQERDPSAGGGHERGEDLEQRGLPAAILAQDAENLAPADGERDPFQRDVRAIGVVEILGDDRGRLGLRAGRIRGEGFNAYGGLAHGRDAFYGDPPSFGGLKRMSRLNHRLLECRKNKSGNKTQNGIHRTSWPFSAMFVYASRRKYPVTAIPTVNP